MRQIPHPWPKFNGEKPIAQGKTQIESGQLSLRRFNNHKEFFRHSQVLYDIILDKCGPMELKEKKKKRQAYQILRLVPNFRRLLDRTTINKANAFALTSLWPEWHVRATKASTAQSKGWMNTRKKKEEKKKTKKNTRQHTATGP
jgi:hypothetical protein